MLTSERIDRGHFQGLAANDNFTQDELPTAIPPGKARERAVIERLTAGHPVRRVGGEAATLATLEARREEILREARRPIVPVVSPAFWIGKPANDNREPQSWPLAEALRRAGRESDIEICEVYRGLWSIMAADPLQGRDPQMADDDEEVHVESRSSLDNGPNFPDVVGGTGELSYKGVRQLTRAPGAATKAVRKGDGDGGDRYRPTAARFTESTLLAQIDMRESWHRLRTAIRPLLAAFEDSCLDGMTMTEVGEVRGFKDKQASAVGKVLVFTAIDTLSEEWGDIRREARQLEEQADRNVIRFRAKRKRAVAAYLGIAA